MQNNVQLLASPTKSNRSFDVHVVFTLFSHIRKHNYFQLLVSPTKSNWSFNVPAVLICWNFFLLLFFILSEFITVKIFFYLLFFFLLNAQCVHLLASPTKSNPSFDISAVFTLFLSVHNNVQLCASPTKSNRTFDVQAIYADLLKFLMTMMQTTSSIVAIPCPSSLFPFAWLDVNSGWAVL